MKRKEPKKKQKKKKTCFQQTLEKLRSFWEKLEKSRVVGAIRRISWKSILRVVGRWVRRRLLPVCCFLLCVAVLISGFALILSAAVKDKTADRIQTAAELAAQGEFDCILVLGCGVYADGTMTPMLSDRVSVGVTLYQSGICNRILMSGDHVDDSYNEVDPMKQAAISGGVPEMAILTDPYGLSTYESIVRAREVYGVERVLIVTQSYHLPRALYLAQKLGMDAYGVSADLRPYLGQFKYDLREVLARCKDVFYAQSRPPVSDAFG